MDVRFRGGGRRGGSDLDEAEEMEEMEEFAGWQHFGGCIVRLAFARSVVHSRHV